MNNMKPSLCGADCSACPKKEACKGCAETNGCPFGGRCIAASYIKAGGTEQYQAFKQTLLQEINTLLRTLEIPEADALYELCGADVNLAYPLPNGEKVCFLDDGSIYLGCQIAFADMGICYGVVADTSFILVCSYSVNGSTPELILYHRR